MIREIQFGRGVLLDIETALDGLPDVLSRIAAFVVAEPEATMRASLAELAAETGCGEASIVRFCKYLGYEGFRDFKLALISDLAYLQSSQVHGSSELADRIVRAIRMTSDGVSEDQLDRTAKRIYAAKHIDIFGSGLTGYVAEIYAYRFSRIGRVARAFRDAVVMEEISHSLGPETVFMAISETGLTVHTERFLSLAKKAGAFTIAVSGRQLSRLYDLCDEVLIATPMFPLPERGETGPVIAKIFLGELLAQKVRTLQGK